jgi:hypothetical protein
MSFDQVDFADLESHNKNRYPTSPAALSVNTRDTKFAANGISVDSNGPRGDH